MTSYLSNIVVDCRDAYALATWWKQVLGYADLPDDPNLPGDQLCAIADPERSDQELLFIEVPEDKTAKNRLHLDLRPRERSRDKEIDVVLGLGATLVADHRGIEGPGTGWVVLADPEGNEFCILRSDAEVAARP